MLKKIAITGPESTGKSSLAEFLAGHFKTIWVEEYARTYLTNIDRKYTSHDLDFIAKTQIKNIKKAEEKTDKMIFADTELLVMKIWYENAFKKCPDWIISELENQKFDLYLLCQTDISWHSDPLREHPHLRSYFFNLYKKELELKKWPYVIISGIGNKRNQIAIDAIEGLFPKNY
ncbi:MAG: ATP-binding protein [Bacteroidales bacterium]|nr:ATP-binding protein [Bacteroidales bacterium]